MAEDFDVEAMLEAPYRKNGAERKGRRLKDFSPEHAKDEHSSSKHRVEKHSDRHKHSERSKDGSKRSGRRSRSRDRRKSKERSKSRRRSREKDRGDRDFKSGRSDKDKERDRGDRGERDKERDRGRNDRDRNDRDRNDRDRNDRDRSDKERNDKDRDRDRDREGRDKEKEKERERRRQRSRSREARRATGTAGAALLALNLLAPLEELAPEERDARTVFCMQLSQNIRSRELEEFFSAVGKVRDVRLITCNKTRRFKGIAYIEFKDTESVPLALGLTGQKLLGIPIIVQHTQAEKNRTGNSLPNLAPKNNTGPTRLYVGSLHFNITEDMLRGIFEPFGKIDNIQLITDLETGKSQGYGFLTFHHAADAKKALEQLNGFELAGRPMKVGNVTERMESAPNDHHPLDTDEMDRAGIDLGATGRLQLMFKLAEGTGFQVPPAAANMLKMTAGLAPSAQQVCPPIATQCFMLNNMFDPATETNPSWDVEIRDDVIEECNKHGGVLHVYVDKGSPQGNVYVKCPDVTVAVASVNSLHGRWFAGRVITAAYVPLVNYHSLFPDAMSSFSLLSLSGMRRNA